MLQLHSLESSRQILFYFCKEKEGCCISHMTSCVRAWEGELVTTCGMWGF